MTEAAQDDPEYNPDMMTMSLAGGLAGEDVAITMDTLSGQRVVIVDGDQGEYLIAWYDGGQIIFYGGLGQDHADVRDYVDAYLVEAAALAPRDTPTKATPQDSPNTASPSTRPSDVSPVGVPYDDVWADMNTHGETLETCQAWRDGDTDTALFNLALGASQLAGLTEDEMFETFFPNGWEFHPDLQGDALAFLEQQCAP